MLNQHSVIYLYSIAFNGYVKGCEEKGDHVLTLRG